VRAVKILFDEDLLAEFDATAEVREQGRSTVLRQLIKDFLRQHREREIDVQYERAYKEANSPLGEEFQGWEDESSEEQIRQIEEGLQEADAGDFRGGGEGARGNFFGGAGLFPALALKGRPLASPGRQPRVAWTQRVRSPEGATDP
jgi:predicted transcriptional regulator